MHPIEHIRRNILKVTQGELGEIAGGTSQATVSRWESGELAPNLDELARIRTEVRARDLAWDDSWFFEVPIVPSEQSETAKVD